MGLVALHTPPSVTHMRIIINKVNIPVLEVSTSVAAFLAFINEQMSAMRLHSSCR